MKRLINIVLHYVAWFIIVLACELSMDLILGDTTEWRRTLAGCALIAIIFAIASTLIQWWHTKHHKKMLE